jgi:threonine synthase
LHSIIKDPREQERKKTSFSLRCYSCSKVHELDEYGRSFYYCKNCGGLLEVRRVPEYSSGRVSETHRKGVWKYYDYIPLWDEENIVSLEEGRTPLIECSNLAAALGLKALYVKFEGLNPTGSFKDRGMTVGVSKAKEMGFKRLICASTGNTSASLAAYSARANLDCTVLVPKGKIALGKTAQALAYGARLVEITGNFDDCLRLASEYCERDKDALLLNSLNPFRIEGQKTAAFEITDQLGFIAQNIIIPMGNGGNISSIWKGFKEIVEFSLFQKMPTMLPKMIGIQAEGAGPIARAFLAGAKAISPLKDPITAATAINIGSPVNWARALGALYDSEGAAGLVDDSEIFSAQKLLASKEGIFVEPASAAPIAFLLKLSKRVDSKSSNRFDEMAESTTVCIATGNGLKDPDAVIKNSMRNESTQVASDIDSFQKMMMNISS